MNTLESLTTVKQHKKAIGGMARIARASGLPLPAPASDKHPTFTIESAGYDIRSNKPPGEDYASRATRIIALESDGDTYLDSAGKERAVISNVPIDEYDVDDDELDTSHTQGDAAEQLLYELESIERARRRRGNIDQDPIYAERGPDYSDHDDDVEERLRIHGMHFTEHP